MSAIPATYRASIASINRSLAALPEADRRTVLTLGRSPAAAGRWELPLHFGPVVVNALIDTGAAGSFVTPRLAQRLGLRSDGRTPYPRHTGTFEIRDGLGALPLTMTATFCHFDRPGQPEMLLGTDFLAKMTTIIADPYMVLALRSDAA